MIEHNYKYKGVVKLEAGGELHDINIRYHTSCDYTTDKKVIWVCHALTANSNAEDWWDTLVGPGLLFDTDKYFVICANILGSCYGTTGPLCCEEASYTSFPLVTVKDMVACHELLCKHLGINHIDFLVGGSNGGFQSIEWAVSNPSFFDNLCLLATSAIISPWITATLEAQRMAIKADYTFDEAKSADGGAKGLAAARSMALTTYRNYQGYCITQPEQDPDFLIAKRACSYQQYQGQKLVNRFDAYSYYSLVNACDTHNVGRHRGGVENALKGVTAKTLCIAIDSDILFPVCDSEKIINNVQNGALEVISSNFGHDGFLLETAQIVAAIKKHFKLFN